MALEPDYPTIRCADGTPLPRYFVESEWLQTDGLGGYASSTLLGCATRRYHGLLIALPPGRSKRHLFVSRFDEALRVDGGEPIALDGTDYGQGEFAVPEGFERYWSRGSGAVRRHVVGDRVVASFGAEARLVRGSPTVLVQYSVRAMPGRGAVELELRPMLPFREADALTFVNDVADLSPRECIGVDRNGVAFRLYDALPVVSLTWSLSPEGEHAARSSTVAFEADPAWHRGVRFAADLARGYDGHEDQPSPGRLVVRSDGWFRVTLAATIGDPIADPAAAWQVEADRAATAQRTWFERFATGDEESGVEPRPASAADGSGGGACFVRAVVAARADDFLYRVPDTERLGICAGYPWFGEWGRDTFLSLPGLTLARGQLDACRDVLAGALPFLHGGLLPNIYGTGIDDSNYGSVDASLWYARAAELYAGAVSRAGADAPDGAGDFVFDALLPALREIAEAYRDGTDLGVGADDGMLISAGGPELNATWMDARTPAGPVTPRDGCAIEINALWIALLDFVAELEREVGGEPGRARALRFDHVRELASATFVERFWLDELGYLADRWHDGIADRKIRPNMVLAAALPRSPLSRAQRRGVVDVTAEHLLTRCGLRTLAPEDPDYIGRYGGGCDERDRAYHQGTVWPWLLGFYTEARLRAYGAGEVAALRARWNGFDRELQRAGLGHISEVFDGDPPHAPGGTMAQAWNSAELLRAFDLLDRWEAAEGDPDAR